MPPEVSIGSIFLHTTKLLHLSTSEAHFSHTYFSDHRVGPWNYFHPDFVAA